MICDGIVQYQPWPNARVYAFLKVRPMSLLFDTVRLWAHEQGARAGILAAGRGSIRRLVVSPHEGVLRPAQPRPTWRWVVERTRTGILCDRNAKRNVEHGVRRTSGDRFPVPAFRLFRGDERRHRRHWRGRSRRGARSARSTARRVPIAARLDDDHDKPGMDADGMPRESHRTGARRPGVIGIGDNARRWDTAERLALGRETVVSIRPPSSTFGKARARHRALPARLFKPHAVIGDHVIVKTGAHDRPRLDHRRLRASRAGCAPLGSVHVGEGAFLGIGSVVIPGVTIGRWSTLEAGAVAYSRSRGRGHSRRRSRKSTETMSATSLTPEQRPPAR